MGSKEAQFEPLIESLSNAPEEEARAEAARLLRSFARDRVAEVLVGALEHDPSRLVQRSAACSLGGMYPFPYTAITKATLGLVVKSLLARLDEEDVELRRAAAWALGEIGQSSAVPGLVAMLVRPRQPARRAAADALLWIAGPKAVRAVLAALRHPEPAVRVTTVRAIAGSAGLSKARWFAPVKTADEVEVNREVGQVVAGLSRLSRDPDPYVRKAVREALQAIRRALEHKRLYGGLDERDDDDDFEERPTLANFEKELPEEARAARAIRAISPEVREARYADFTFLHDSTRQRLASGECLREGEWYALEVAVRARPAGAPAAKGRLRRAILEPRQEAAVTLHVTAEGDGAEIEEPVDTLVLPPAGDSTKQAVFRLRPVRAGTPALVRIRVYYRFNLLEEATVSAEVLGKLASAPEHVSWKLPIAVIEQRRQLEYVDLAAVEPREMHVDVVRRGDEFLFQFTFYNDVDQRVEMAGATPLQATDLEDSLVAIREVWQSVALSETFCRGIEATPEEFTGFVRRLAQAGHGLWVKLFRLRSRSALSRIGEWLREHPPRQGALIQISLERDAGTFVFPWALLYDRPLPRRAYELPDPEGFWGLRYSIEQRLPDMIQGPDGASAVREALDLGVLQWDQFRNIGLQNSLIERLSRESDGRLRAGAPITTAATAYDQLAAGWGDVLYFYAHGYTRQRASDLGASSGFELFLRRYESLAENSPLRELYREVYLQIRDGRVEPDRSWIELTYGKLYLDELYDSILGLPQHPLVVLNLCESAQVTPSLADSFIHFFLDRGARAVVGTECSMTIEFAHPFSETFLRALFAGQPAGLALLNARRHFMARRNPLGLAYTLFGQATAGFLPPPLPASRPEEEHARIQ